MLRVSKLNLFNLNKNSPADLKFLLEILNKDPSAASMKFLKETYLKDNNYL